jgi:hypothetical protein
METVTREVKVTVPIAGVPEGAVPIPEASVAPEIIIGIHIDVLPESSMDVVVRSPEIQDAEPIRAAPMSEAATTSRDGLNFWPTTLLTRRPWLAT